MAPHSSRVHWEPYNLEHANKQMSKALPPPPTAFYYWVITVVIGWPLIVQEKVGNAVDNRRWSRFVYWSNLELL